MTHAHLTLALLVAAAATGCANPERSRDLANPNVAATILARQVCSNCHGVTGNSTSPNFPNLAGQTREYLVAQLQGFRNHRRRDPAGFEYMWGLSRNLTDEQINGLADYFASQTLVPQPMEGAPAMLTAGKSVFKEGVPARKILACASCHGAEGAGNGSFPRIAGQHADYVVKQLIVFQRTDERSGSEVMQMVAHELAREDIDNVAAYVQSLAKP